MGTSIAAWLETHDLGQYADAFERIEEPVGAEDQTPSGSLN